MEKLACDNHSVLTWQHPRFLEFAELFTRLTQLDEVQINFPRIKGTHTLTKIVLKQMGFDVQKTLEWMEGLAAYDDIQVGFIIIAGYWEQVDRGEIAPPWDGQFTT